MAKLTYKNTWRKSTEHLQIYGVRVAKYDSAISHLICNLRVLYKEGQAHFSYFKSGEVETQRLTAVKPGLSVLCDPKTLGEKRLLSVGRK